ncbi:hypothetical protein H8959_001781, partial [Pygathrix nigripes]
MSISRNNDLWPPGPSASEEKKRWGSWLLPPPPLLPEPAPCPPGALSGYSKSGQQEPAAAAFIWKGLSPLPRPEPGLQPGAPEPESPRASERRLRPPLRAATRASRPAAPLTPGPAPPRQGCIMATLACRVQFLDDTDPFNSTNFPEPSRPPLFTFREDLALGTQLAGVHRLLRAPHK